MVALRPSEPETLPEESQPTVNAVERELLLRDLQASGHSLAAALATSLNAHLVQQKAVGLRTWQSCAMEIVTKQTVCKSSGQCSLACIAGPAA